MRRPRPSPAPWTAAERRVLDRLDSPVAIQAFLDGIPYSDDPIYRCPRRVLADRRAHCFDGALLAAAALRRLGHPPLLVDLKAVRDDDHIIVLFRGAGGGLGAIAQSNFAGLRYREPIHRSLRELVLSYFEPYFNVEGLKTLRAYSAPLDLGAFDGLEWLVRSEAMEAIAARLESIRHYPLLTRAQERGLRDVDERTFRTSMIGVVDAGLYRPGKERA
ncbi:MAG TPA: hypothetical protein VGQ83_13965 [Polyangia bacterium]|jgi:hypothetical protein